MKIKKITLIKFFIQGIFFLGLFLNFMPEYKIIGKWLFLPIILFGVFFCGWVCPFGSLQEWLHKFAKLIKLPQFKIPIKIQKYLQISRYLLYILSTIGITFALLNARSAFNNKLFQGELNLIAGIILTIFIITSLFISRPFCNYFCAKGAYYGILSVLRIFGIKREENNCIHCKKCTQNCPMNIEVENEKFINHPNCINCLNCIYYCPKKCIKFGQK